MKAFITVGLMSLALVLSTAPLQADEGKALHDNNCTSCHSTDVFTRDDRSIKSLEGLKTRVNQCNGAIENKLSDDDLKSVAQYLNHDFYKFDEK